MKQTPKPFFLRIVFFSALITLYLAPYGQIPTPVPHTLLWRISGKGLQKPSYLYGAMHLNDKRLFQFGDSLYHAIESSEGLAIEVNPDEMAAYYVNQLFDQLESGKKLQDLLGKEYFASHKKALAKKFGKPAEDIKAMDVFKEKNKWMGEYFRKGEMPTFMDAYLYNIARRQGKWSGGIEDIGDQTGLMEDLVDQSDVNYLLHSDDAEQVRGSSEIEKMVRLYTAQDLEGIQRLTDDGSTPEVKDKLLLHRNVKMARRIDSLSAIRSMVFAVGCAHLPGDSGIIDLLRKKGFTVEPVFSSKKIASSNYTFKEIHLPWIKVSDEPGSYSVEMPANPATVHIYGLVEMKFLMDLFNMSGFGTMSVVNASHIRSRDSIFRKIAVQMFHGEAPAGKNLVKNGIHGKEYIHYDESGNVRLQLFADTGRIYMAVLSALKKDMLQTADAEKFFGSFTITGLALPPVSTGFTTFTDRVIGVRFVSPFPLSYNQKLSSSKEESWKATTYTGLDSRTGAMVMLLSRSLKPGYHLADLNGSYRSMENMFTAQYDHLQKDSVYQDSIKFIHYKGQSKTRPEIFVSAVTVVKDGRLILLMVACDTAEKNLPSLLKPIQSFSLIPYAPARWNTYESPEHLFSFYGPSPSIYHVYKKNKEWVSYDSASGSSYLIIPDTLGKYAWYSTDSTMWKTMLQSDTGGMSVVEIKDVSNGGIAGKEFILRSKTNVRAWSRTRLLVSGDKLFKLFAFGEPWLIRSPEVNRFFDSFRLVKPEPPRFTESKTALILHDLESKDSITVVRAYNALHQAPVRKKDAPLLRDALFKSYKQPYDTVMGVMVNNSIGRRLAELKDSASIDYIRRSYAGLVSEKEPFRLVALAVLMRTHTSYSYGVLAELLKQGPTKERLDFTQMDAMKDSLALSMSVYPYLLTWARDSLHVAAIASLSLRLVDSGYLSREALASSAGNFTSSARDLLPGLKANSSFNQNYYVSSLIDLLGRMHDPEAYGVLKDYQSVNNLYLVSKTITQLLEGQQAVSSAALQRLAADPSYRLSLYEELKKHDKAAMFPKEYLTQSAMALAALYRAAEYDDEEIEDATFLSKRTAAYKGKSYTFYLYKVCYPDDEGKVCHLGIAGGYDPMETGLEPKTDLSGVYMDEDFEGQKAGELLKAWLKAREE